MKTVPDALGTTENESGSAKHEDGTRRPPHRRKRVMQRKTLKRDPKPAVPLKTSLSVQNLETGADALSTAENEYGAQNMKMGPDALGTTEKRVRESKT
jgi:hypothetical protein